MPYLSFQILEGSDLPFELTKALITLGRDAKNDIAIKNGYVSSKHAIFKVRDDGNYSLEDLDSANGTFVNDEKITNAVLKPGDELRFGQVCAKYIEGSPKIKTAQSTVIEALNFGQTLNLTQSSGKGKTGASRVVSSSNDQFKGTMPSPLPAILPVAPKKTGGTLIEGELETKKAELSKMEQELTIVYGEIAKANELKRDVDETVRQLDNMKRELLDVTKDVDIAKKSLAALHADAEKTHHERNQGVQELAALRSELNNQQSTASNQLQTMQHQMQIAQQRIADLEVQEAALQAKAQVSIDELNQKFQLKAAELKQLEDSLAQGQVAVSGQLKESEQRINQELQQKTAVLAELQKKLEAEEARLSELTTATGKMLPLGPALADLETKHNELKTQVEALQVQEQSVRGNLNSVLLSFQEEHAKLEKVKADRVAAEEEYNNIKGYLNKQGDSNVSSETEQRKKLSDMENRVAQMMATYEKIKRELVSLEQKKQNYEKLHSQVDQLQETEKRLRLQLTELEEKHVIIRKNLNSDENTVIMFANDLIKRMDLIDKLTERYVNKDNTVADQLRGLKTSLEDLLNQHGVSPFEMSPGTEVDGTISTQINIIEGIPGERKTRITKVMRPGFRYRCANGATETILRKVEVNTSSQ